MRSMVEMDKYFFLHLLQSSLKIKKPNPTSVLRDGVKANAINIANTFFLIVGKTISKILPWKGWIMSVNTAV